MRSKIRIIGLAALLVFVVLGFALTAAANGSIGEGTALQITLVNHEPDPVEPGSFATLRFKIENSGSGVAEDMAFELLPEYPFSLDSGVSPVKNVGSVWGRQKGDLGVIVKYNVRVDENAAEGINEINARYKLKNGDWIKVGPYNISVQPSRAVLAIKDVKIAPETIAPGEQANISILLQNIAKSAVKDISVKLDFSTSATFVPFGYSEKTIKLIKPDETNELNFAIIAQPDAAAGAYKILLTLSYLDELNNEYSRNGTLGVVVGGDPELLSYIESSTLYTKNNYGEISIKFVNKGLTDIKFLNVKLMDNEGYKIISQNNVYIGKVSSDDYETAEFSIYAESESLRIPVRIEYSDANNNQYSEQRVLEMKLYSESEAKKFGIKKENGSGLLVTIAIVAVGIILFHVWRRIKK